MTKFFAPAQISNSINLDQFIDYVEREIDFEDPASIAEAKGQIQAVASDPTWFIEYLNKEIEQDLLRDRAVRNEYTSNTFLILVSKKGNYFIRANVWMPSDDPLRREVPKSLYAEEFLHDHTFDLLTVGLLGSGYRTTVYNYAGDAIIGNLDERVPVDEPVDLQLSPGAAIFMEKNVTIHRQHPPEDISVSLNLACRDMRDPMRKQYEFEEDTQGILRIRGIHYSDALNPNATESLINICGSFYNERTKSMMLNLFEYMAKRPNLHEQNLLVLLDWFNKVGISVETLPQLKGKISKHLKSRLSPSVAVELNPSWF